MKKKSVLFLPASIRSHILPAIYIADFLSKNYDIYFAVTNTILKEIVERQGFNAVQTDIFRAGMGMEASFLRARNKKFGKLETLKCILENDVYNFRQNELSKIVDRITPDAIFIDIFNSTDILVLYPKYKKIRFIFLNPMLSTYRVNGFPAVEEEYWPDNNSTNIGKKQTQNSLGNWIKQPMNSLAEYPLDRQFRKMTKKEDFSVTHPIAQDRTNALIFGNIPEVLLAPLELEVSPEIQKQNQHYLGLCVSVSRQDTELDPNFKLSYDNIQQAKKSGRRLIYCSFGTFYEGSDRALLEFLQRLMDAVHALENIIVIFSVNKLVIETLCHQRQIPENVYMFSRVPQLKVLNDADLFITHGGLGSVKESIYYGVPMLVYPLDPLYDQKGNGLKVEFHGLGLRGRFQVERSSDMKKKIQELLVNPRFKNSTMAFRNVCFQKYSIAKISDSLFQLLH